MHGQALHSLDKSLNHVVNHWRPYAVQQCRSNPQTLTTTVMLNTAVQQKKRKEKTTPFGVNLMRSQVLYRAAQFALQQNELFSNMQPETEPVKLKTGHKKAKQLMLKIAHAARKQSSYAQNGSCSKTVSQSCKASPQ